VLVAVLPLPGSVDAAFTGSTSTPANTFAAAASFPSYPATIAADHPSVQYRLDDAFTDGTAVDEAGGPGAVYDLPYRFGVAGAIGDGDTALAFDPSRDANIGVHDADSVNDPEVFSEEIWFKTTTTTGGKLIGFGNSQDGESSNYDRHIYMLDDGRLEFGVWNANPGATLATSSSYNDGNWHQVVATLGPAGLVLYVDGAQQGADPATTTAQAFTGYWRIGGDNLGFWPDQPSSDHFTGELDEVSVYSTQLTAARISAHYAARTGAGYSASVLADSPYLYWRLGDTSGGTVADAGSHNHPGHVVDWVTDVPAATSGATGDGDGAAYFDGRSTIGSARTFDNPVTYSEECWFRTTTTTGGKLMGFGYRQASTSFAYDRHVYMQNDGRLTFGVNVSAGTTTITTPSAYNDGAWHHVVATSGAGGLSLYVDGALQADDPSAEGGEQHPDYFRVGGDNLGAWPDQPWTDYFTGSIDEVAVYPYELTAAEVGAHHAAAAGSYKAAVLADSPDLYWRLDEPDFGRPVADSSPEADEGYVGAIYGFVRVDGPMRGGQTATHAIHFLGQVGLSDPVPQTSPDVFSLEFWVRTMTLTGGKIIGFGDRNRGLSASDDRHVYMSDDGTISFGIFNAGTVTITTPRAYNDGVWHHVVATFGPAGMRLYVDGRVRAANAGLTAATDYTGYWRVGGDGVAWWPGEPSDYFFQGDLAEIAVYPTQLSDEQVSRHYYANH